MQEQPHLLRIEDLFTPEHNTSLSYFYASNKIIANPILILQFFRDFSEYSHIIQENTLNEIINLLEHVSINAHTLNQAYFPNQPISNVPHIIDDIIEILPNYANNFIIFSKLMKMVDSLLRMSSLKESIVDRGLQKLSQQFYSISEECFHSKTSVREIQRKYLFASAHIIKSFFNAKLNIDKQPSKMLIFNGNRCLEIQNPSKQNNWIFGQGLSVYFWINLQNIKFGSEAPLPKLFTFYSPNHGGLECYLIDSKVYYRALGSKYSQPQIGSNGLLLGQIEPKKWVFFGLEHEPPKRLLGRSQINFYLNQKKTTFHLSPPSISSKQKMKIMLFDRAYCKTSSICILPKFGQSEIIEALSKNKNSIDSFKNHKCFILQERQGRLFERKGELGYCPDKIISRDRTMSFQPILPLFKMLKHTAKSEDSLLNEILHLFVLYLLKSHENQINAQKNNYPHIIAELIKQLPNLYEQFNSETIGVLLHIKQSITNSQLLVQYYAQFLWAFIDADISISRKQEILEIIKNSFTQNISYFSSIIGLDQMINVIVKLQKKSVRCCEKHFKIMSQRLPKKQIMEFEAGFGQTQVALDYILKMIELYIQNQKLNLPLQLYKLCKLLSFSNKFSPCFTNSLLNLLRKILTQRMTEKLNSGQSKKIFEYLQSKKVYLLLLYVIENSFFAEIKAESVKIVYNVLMKKTNENEQKQISHRIAKSLWKINEQNQNYESVRNSSMKLDEKNSEENLKIDVQDEILEKEEEHQFFDEQEQEEEVQAPMHVAENQEEYQEIGPQAPKLSNRLKGKKTFNFNFMSDNDNQESSPAFGSQINKQKKKRRNSEDSFKMALTIGVGQKPNLAKLSQKFNIDEGLFYKNEEANIPENKLKIIKKQSRLLFKEDTLHDSTNFQQIMEEEKTNENAQNNQKFEEYSHNNEPQTKIDLPKKVIKLKKSLNLNLNIDTQAINEMYTFGGEKGQQIFVSEEQQAEQLTKIRRLAKICVCKMKNIPFTEEQCQKQEKIEIKNPVIPPSTTSNRMLKLRQRGQSKKKLQNLKLISEEDESFQDSAKKPALAKNISLNFSIPSPNYTKKSKSPSSIIKISEENMITLYNSLMECCIGSSNFQIIVPSILNIFFSWIPQTNLQAKFIMDLLLVLDNDEDQKKIWVISQMPELYDFLLQLTYKGLLFEEMEEQLLFMKRLEELLSKIFWFIFKNDSDYIEKLYFIFEWAKSKVVEYHPKCLFLTTRNVFHIIMSSVEQNLFTHGCDKTSQKNFQYLGIVLDYLTKFLPIPEDETIFIDQFQRVILTSEFKMIASIAPNFTSSWADYIICEKYLLLFKKFLCTDWYTKCLKTFKNLKISNETAVQNFMNSVLSSLQITAQAQFYMKNSFIFTLFEINRYILVQKTLSRDIRLSSSVQENEESQFIWQTIFILILAECNKDKNQKINSEFVLSFLKSCKVLKDLEVNEATIIIPILFYIREYYKTPSVVNMTGSGLFVETNRQTAQTSGQIKNIINPVSFVESLIENYINEKLFQPQEELGAPHYEFQAFKLNFEQIVIPDNIDRFLKENKQQFFSSFIEYSKKIDKMEEEFIDEFTNVLEEENQRFNCTQVLLQTASRKARSQFRKLWKVMRIYGGPWTHPDLRLQNDVLFNKHLFTYEKFESNHVYRWRIAKHTSKYRLRYLLKPVLFEPFDQDKNNREAHEQFIKEKEQIGLNRALSYFASNKLVLGKRVLNWLFGKTTESMEIIMSFKKVRMIKTLTIRHGYLGIMNQKLLFVSAYLNEPQTHLSISEYKLKRDKTYYKVWPIEYVKQIFRRRYVNRKRALEITFIHGKSILLEFHDGEQEEFLKKILKLKGNKCPNLIYNGHKSLDPRKMYESEGLNKKWNTFEITNFQYLMELNNLASRSYADLTQYPVMPWVLVNFNNKLMMHQTSNYRDLSLPMGALGKQERAHGFRDRYQNMGQIQEQKFHYGTHYSSPGIVYHFLVRISPFTEGSVLLQSGKFDFADRMFFSIADSYQNATSEFSDVRELLPELYTIPEFYLNINKLDMGIMQNQKRVHNVELPGWAKDNPYLYVTKLRKAFEENCVSKSINKWIDLIFGYKQRGQEAEKNLNCYVHLTYEDSVNFDSMKEKKAIISVETQILNFGQTPSQLFIKPHPERSSITTLPTYGMICDPGVQPKIYRPTKQNNQELLKDEKKFNAMQQPEDSIIHMRWFKDSKLVFIRKKGQMLWYKWHTSHTATNPRAPFQCAIEKQRHISIITKKALLETTELIYDPSLVTESFPIEFYNNGHSIALGGLIDGKLLIIDADSNALIEQHHLHQHTISYIKSDDRNNFLITGDITGKVIIWRITSMNKLVMYNEIKDHTQQITNIFISYDLRFFFTAGEDGVVFGYNIITGKKMKVFYHPKKLPINNIIVSTCPLPVIILFSNQQSILYCFSINGQLVQRVHEKNIEHFLSPILIKDSSGLQHLAYGNQNGETIIRALPFLDNPSKHTVARDASVNRICISKSGKFIITGCSDGQLSVITSPDIQK